MLGRRSRQFIVFAAVGVTATALQWGILIIGVEFFRWPPAVGSGVGFLISASANYLLNYRLTFRSSRAHLSAASRFFVVAGFGLLLNVALMQLLTNHWRFQYLLAQTVATIVVIAWTFSGSAFWSFASEADH